MLTANEIRQKYLEYFKDRGHTIIPSSSLIPENDPSLLFTNSGMFPLVPYLLGETHPGGKRLTDSQKSFRTEDIEEVGDNRHNTFFEMLGNWSLGDYFKAEQLEWWYDFMFNVLQLDPNRIYQSVYAGDDLVAKDTESIEILKKLFAKYGIEATEGPTTITKGDLGPGVPIEFGGQTRIFAYRDKNWWKRGDAVGELGGPDSETFYDTGKAHNPKFGPHCHINCDCGRFLEIGNSVFMQYQKTETGWKELENKNVDFGGGLERIAMVVQGKDNIFETDLFSNIIHKIERLSGKTYREYPRAFEIIADHLKAATFILGDDKAVRPSNVGQGYIVRRLIRRAVTFGRQIGIAEDLWTKDIAKIVVHDYSQAFPELERNIEFVVNELKDEEAKFSKTIERGLKIFDKKTAELTSGNGLITGKEAFDLYQTYGFPIEMTMELAAEKELTVDNAGFDEELRKHQELSRTASAGMFKGGLADSSEETTKLHTAAHLLLAALRQVLGHDVIQKGSNITAERLRFDFSWPEKMTDDQKKQVEDLVNKAIQQKLPVTCEEISLDEAKKRGAMGIFDNKYGEQVKVYTIGGQNGTLPVSCEICGGPHVENLETLGVFKIAKEESSSSGVRRIKAILIN